MANRDQVVGLSPHGRPLRQREYIAASVIYPGDPVKLKNDGKVEIAAASNALCGVAASYASGDGVKVNVYDDPDQLFEIQADDASIDAQTDLNLNYNIVVGSPNTVYKRSGVELDGNTGATDSTLPLKLLSVSKRVDNALGEFADCIVKINNHQLDGGTGTEGV